VMNKYMNKQTLTQFLHIASEISVQSFWNYYKDQTRYQKGLLKY
jgi:hypothetical protein